MGDDGQAMLDWPAALTTFLLTTYGAPQSSEQLGGMSDASVWRVRCAGGSVIVKASNRASEFRFYREVAPTLRANGVDVPELRWSARDAASYWLALEDIPTSLPRERWLADSELLAVLSSLHQLDLTPPPDLPLFRPQWTDEMSAAALSCFTPTVAAILREPLKSLQATSVHLGPDCYISGDPNPMNWGVREDGTLSLYDWERFGRGAVAFDLAITVPGLGSMDDYRLVASRYSGEQGAAAQQLAVAIAVAKVWVVVEFFSFHALGNAATSATVARLLGVFPGWAKDIAANRTLH